MNTIVRIFNRKKGRVESEVEVSKLRDTAVELRKRIDEFDSRIQEFKSDEKKDVHENLQEFGSIMENRKNAVDDWLKLSMQINDMESVGYGRDFKR